MLVLPDANVLLPRTLRDWLLLLNNESGHRIFTITTSEDIVVEVLSNLRKRNPMAHSSLIEGVRTKILDAAAEVVTDFAVKMDSPIGDDGDAHVHAAAVAAGVNMVITNDKGFLGLSDETLDSLPYEVIAPDEFFLRLDQAAPGLVPRVAELQAAYWLKTRGSADLPKYLAKAGCHAFAERVRVILNQRFR